MKSLHFFSFSSQLSDSEQSSELANTSPSEVAFSPKVQRLEPQTMALVDSSQPSPEAGTLFEIITDREARCVLSHLCTHNERMWGDWLAQSMTMRINCWCAAQAFSERQSHMLQNEWFTVLLISSLVHFTKARGLSAESCAGRNWGSEILNLVHFYATQRGIDFPANFDCKWR